MEAATKSPHDLVKAQLSAKVAEAEEALRKLKIIEEYEALMSEATVPAVQEQTSDESATQKPRSNLFTFPLLKKSEAAAEVLEVRGSPLSMEEIFSEMKRRGHGVSSVNSLRSGLSRDPRFINLGARKWDLASRHPKSTLPNAAQGEREQEPSSVTANDEEDER